MIPRSPQARQPAWQTALNDAIRDPQQLLQELGLPPELLPGARRAAARFGLRVPRGFLARMRRGDPADPLLRQVLPLDAELEEVAGYGDDPLDECEGMAAPGVLHKYAGRVLLTVTGACAIHCRYCFRRHYPYASANPTRVLQHTIDYLQRRQDVSELILSGGDPLSLSDARLRALVASVEAVPQLKRLRIHTRLPVVLPERVDGELLAWLSASRLDVVMVIHCNHPAEIDPDTGTALLELQRAGVTLLNQSVLLRGVNDRAETLAELSQILFEYKVLPYYLHQLDRVRGAAHFEVPDGTAVGLLEDLRARLPGYLVPRLVREQPGRASKTPL
ncbi:MAG TPA: EF-P beta-lysylation protein EpmB [Gammaproteobacteria bacterium]|nr:EF-P beta-lysylation protein EpmB [Gammaproteobacteria bacterium]